MRKRIETLIGQNEKTIELLEKLASIAAAEQARKNRGIPYHEKHETHEK